MARASTAAARPATSTLAAPPGRSAPASAATTAGRVVDHLEHRVAEHQVDAARLDQAGERVAVALHRPYPVGDPGVGGPAGQRGERVRAGVDDRDVVARPRPAARRTRRCRRPRRGRSASRPAGQLAAQHRPDDRGARAGACRCSLHPQKPNARFAGTGARISPPGLPCDGFSLERGSNEFAPPEGNTK